MAAHHAPVHMSEKLLTQLVSSSLLPTDNGARRCMMHMCLSICMQVCADTCCHLYCQNCQASPPHDVTQPSWQPCFKQTIWLFGLAGAGLANTRQAVLHRPREPQDGGYVQVSSRVKGALMSFIPALVAYDATNPMHVTWIAVCAGCQNMSSHATLSAACIQALFCSLQ
jgi:hypothetical protein